MVFAAGDSKGTISGKNVSFAPYSVLNAEEIIQYRVVAKAVAEGDSRVKAEINSDLLKAPVTEVKSTQVY